MLGYLRSFLLVSVISLIIHGNSFAEEKAKVVATVNGEELTSVELQQEINKILPMEKGFHGHMSPEKMQEVEKKALATLVDMELQYQDALRKGLKLSTEAMDGEINKLASKYKSRDDFEAAVKRAGFTDKSMARFVERNVLSEKIKKQEVDDKVKVTAEDVAKYYETNTSKYQKPEEYRASQILVKVDPSSNAEQKKKFRERAESLLKKVRAGANFADLAALESDDNSRIKGGDLGYFHSGQAVEEFENAIKTMKVGEVSDIVESLYGFHIIKLTERKAPRALPFDEVKDKIRRQMETQQKDENMKHWMDGLKSSAKIVYSAK